jgi:hypothetical protein
MIRSDYYVYVLFRENGVPFYVGKGTDNRWVRHEGSARRGDRGRVYDVIRRMLALGIEVPKVKVHDGLTETVAHEYEIALIAAIGRGRRGPLVNMTDGGEGTSGWKPSPETIAKFRARPHTKTPEFSAAASARNRARTPEQKAAFLEACRNKSPEHIEKIRLAATNPSDETRAKMSAAASRRRFAPGSRASQGAAMRAYHAQRKAAGIPNPGGFKKGNPHGAALHAQRKAAGIPNPGFKKGHTHGMATRFVRRLASGDD